MQGESIFIIIKLDCYPGPKCQLAQCALYFASGLLSHNENNENKQIKCIPYRVRVFVGVCISMGVTVVSG